MDEQPPQLPGSNWPPPPLPPLPIAAQRVGTARDETMRSRQEKGGCRSSVSLLLLIIACGALGMALNWGMKQRALASRLAGQMDGMRTQVALSAAGDSDLTMLLTGESSERVVLQAESRDAHGQAALVWDRKLGKGMLFCQGVWPASAGQRYHLWLGSAAGKAALTMVATFDAQPDSTVVRFHAPEVQSPARFVISADPEGALAPARPLFTGQGS